MDVIWTITDYSSYVSIFENILFLVIYLDLDIIDIFTIHKNTIIFFYAATSLKSLRLRKLLD